MSEAQLPRPLGPWLLLSSLGSGGAGEVYLAEMREKRAYASKGSRVAVKVLRGDRLPPEETFLRFQREVRLGLSFDHPCLVRTLDAEVVDDGEAPCHAIVMEHVPGRTLRTLMDELGVLPEPLLRHVGARIARGLAAIHAGGAMHRDLKPGNVIITPEHEVRILDLGSARLRSDDDILTRTGHFVGTLLYAAPEQLSDGARPASDLHALGVVLHEATGRHPFEAREVGVVVKRILHDVPSRLGVMQPQVSLLLEEMVVSLLEKSPGARPSSADEVADALDEGEASAWWRARRASMAAAAPAPRRTLRRAARALDLVGRADELATLDAALASARVGRGAVVLVEGEAGVGKSRLVDELLARSDALDEMQVLVGASAPGEMGVRGAVAEALLARFGGGGDDTLAESLARYLPGAPRLAHALAAFVLGTPPKAGVEPLSPEAVSAALQRLLDALSRERPVAWIVEDIHFASADARALALSLARHAAGRHALIVLTSRPGLPPEDLAALRRIEGFSHVAVPRLSAKEVMELLVRALHSEALADRIGGKVARKSDGNPYFVLEMLRELEERGLLRRQGDGAFSMTSDVTRFDVPSSVRDLLAQRLRELSEDDRVLLDVAALLGFSFDADLIARVLGMPRLAVLQSLATIERRTGIVRASGAAFQFDHHQLQEVLRDELPEALRREYHALVAAALCRRDGIEGDTSARGEMAVAVAEHFLRARRAPEGWRHLGPAIDHLAAQHRHEAVLDMVALGRSQDAEPPADLGFEMLACEADAARVLGRGDQAEEAARLALASPLAASDPARRARALAVLGLVMASRSRITEAASLLEEAVDLSRAAGDRRCEAKALGGLARALLNLARFDETVGRCNELLAVARALGERNREAEAEMTLGAAMNVLDGPATALGHYERAQALAEETGELGVQATASRGLAQICATLGRRDEAQRHAETSLRIARDSGFRYAEGMAWLVLAILCDDADDLAGIRSNAERGLVIFRDIGNLNGRAASLSLIATAAVREGRLDDAEVLLEEAIATARSLGVGSMAGSMLIMRADLHRARGDGEAEELDARAALATALETGDTDLERDALLPLGRLAWDRNDREQARTWFARAAELIAAHGRGTTSVLVEAHRVLLGDARAEDVVFGEVDRLQARAEAHVLLHDVDGGNHLAEARAFLERCSAHLDEAGRRVFWARDPVARMLLRAESGVGGQD